VEHRRSSFTILRQHSKFQHDNIYYYIKSIYKILWVLVPLFGQPVASRIMHRIQNARPNCHLQQCCKHNDFTVLGHDRVRHPMRARPIGIKDEKAKSTTYLVQRIWVSLLQSIVYGEQNITAVPHYSSGNANLLPVALDLATQHWRLD
jgi:hypothetical protein